MPYPPLDGGAQVMQFTTQGLLHHGVSLDLLAINPTRRYTDLTVLPEDSVRSTRFRAVKVDTRVRPARLLLNLCKKESYFIERFYSEDFEKTLADILSKNFYDIVQLEHLYLCLYIGTIRTYSSARIVLRPQNVEHVIWQRYLKGVRNPLSKFLLSVATKRLKRFEVEAGSLVDGIIALTGDDAGTFSSFTKVPVTILPMGYFHDKLGDFDFEKQYRSRPLVYHLGSMDWLPNEEAVRWFLTRVMPHLSQHKRAKVIIAGRKMPTWVYKYRSEQVDVLDEVKTPVEFQEDKPIMIVPLLSGSGIRAKIIEGLAMGKTFISTSVGAQGIACVHGKNILIADDEKSFAALILKCIDDQELCREIGTNARRLSAASYHYQSIGSGMIRFYSELLSNA
jgi:polysaccharide biosynthesis protein PslH